MLGGVLGATMVRVAVPQLRYAGGRRREGVGGEGFGQRGSGASGASRHDLPGLTSSMRNTTACLGEAATAPLMSAAIQHTQLKLSMFFQLPYLFG